MTAKIDASREAVRMHLHRLETRGGATDKVEAAEIIRALLAERDLSAAREAAAWIAGRDAAATEAERGCETAPLRDSGLMQAIADSIRDLTPPTDTTALDRLIAERVREAVEAEREACAKVADEYAERYQHCLDASVLSEHMSRYSMLADAVEEVSAAVRARGSKEGRDDAST